MLSFKKNSQLAGDNAATDMVIDFFFEELPSCESILWVNSVSPLQSIQDIKKFGIRLYSPNVDCVMAANTLYQHCCFGNKSLNFDPGKAFEKTQDLESIRRYIYICMRWNRETYVKSRLEGFKGLFPGIMSLVEVSKLVGMLIKYGEDFILCFKIEKAMDLFQISNIDIPNSIPTHYQ